MKIISGTLIVAALCATGTVYAEGSAAATFPPATEAEALGLMPAGSTPPAANTAPRPAAQPAPPVAVAVPGQPQAVLFPPPVANPSQAQYSYPGSANTANAPQFPNPTMVQQPAYSGYPNSPYGNQGAYPLAAPYGYNPYMARPMVQQQQPMKPQPPKKKVTKAWGDTRYIWPDFYTDTTGDMWDKMMNAPYDMGRMPGGWRFPYLSSPDPVTVGDAVTNQFPPMVDEIPNFINFTK